MKESTSEFRLVLVRLRNAVEIGAVWTFFILAVVAGGWWKPRLLMSAFGLALLMAAIELLEADALRRKQIALYFGIIWAVWGWIFLIAWGFRWWVFR